MGGQWEVMWGLWGSWEVSEGSWEVSGGSWEVSESSWEVSGRLKGGHGRSPGGYKMLIANAITEQRLYPSFFGSDIWVKSESNLSPMKTKQEHKVSYRCSLPSPLQKGSKDWEVLIRLIHKCEIRWTLTNSLLEPLTLILMKILKSLWRIRFQTQLTTKLHLHQFSMDLSWPKVMSRTITKCQ